MIGVPVLLSLLTAFLTQKDIQGWYCVHHILSAESGSYFRDQYRVKTELPACEGLASTAIKMHVSQASAQA